MVLALRMMWSLQRNPCYSSSFRMEFASKGLRLCVSRSGLDSNEMDGTEPEPVCIHIGVDTSTGRFVLDSEGLTGLLSHAKRSFELFQAEINNIDSQAFCSAFVRHCGITDFWTVLHTSPFSSQMPTLVERTSLLQRIEETRRQAGPLSNARLNTLDEVLEHTKLASAANIIRRTLPSNQMAQGDGMCPGISYDSPTFLASMRLSAKLASKIGFSDEMSRAFTENNGLVLMLRQWTSVDANHTCTGSYYNQHFPQSLLRKKCKFQANTQQVGITKSALPSGSSASLVGSVHSDGSKHLSKTERHLAKDVIDSLRTNIPLNININSVINHYS